MGYSSRGCKESDVPERLTLLLYFRAMFTMFKTIVSISKPQNLLFDFSLTFPG